MSEIEDYIKKNIEEREHQRKVEEYYDTYISKHHNEKKDILSADYHDLRITIMRIFDKAEDPESLMDIPIDDLIKNADK